MKDESTNCSKHYSAEMFNISSLHQIQHRKWNQKREIETESNNKTATFTVMGSS